MRKESISGGQRTVDPVPALIAATSMLVLLALYDWMTADAYMMLYAGRWMVEHGLPSTDPFTAIGAGRDWINSQWAANLAFYGAHVVGGYAAVTRVSIVAVALSLTMLARVLRQRGASIPTTIGGTIWTMFVAVAFVPPRAQNLVLPLFVLLVWTVLDDDRRVARRLGEPRPWRTVAVLVVVLIAWSNLHGSSVMAAALVAGYACWRCAVPGTAARHPWVALAVAAPSSLLATPNGVDVFVSHAAVSSNDALLAHTPEWASVLTMDGIFQAGAPVLIGIGTMLLAWRRRDHVQAPLVAGVALLTLAALLQARYALWLGYLEVILAADLLTSRRARDPRQAGALVQWTLWGAAAAFAIIAVVSAARTERDHQLRLSPVATVDAAWDVFDQDEDQRILGDLETSALLLWEHPDVAGHILFDPRLEVFPSDDLERWYRFRQARTDDWFDAAAGADIMLASEEWSPRLADRLARRPGRVIPTPDGVVLVADGAR